MAARSTSFPSASMKTKSSVRIAMAAFTSFVTLAARLRSYASSIPFRASDRVMVAGSGGGFDPAHPARAAQKPSTPIVRIAFMPQSFQPTGPPVHPNHRVLSPFVPVGPACPRGPQNPEVPMNRQLWSLLAAAIVLASAPPSPAVGHEHSSSHSSSHSDGYSYGYSVSDDRDDDFGWAI